MPDNRRYGYRCTPCDVNYPYMTDYEKCPVCAGETWRIIEEAVDILDHAGAIKFIQQKQFEARQPNVYEADLAAARKMGRGPYHPRAYARIIELAKETLKALPVANRFDIPPEERCPEYEAEVNPRA